ncbi:2750_t:CDS:2, partial [Cetraspora pellucida]
EDVEIVRFNQLSALDMDEEIGSEEEDDEDREIDESTIKVLRNITDICTRWNSSYSSWTRLLELKDAITWLASVLPLKKGKENKKDGQKLSQLLLKDYEWDLLKRIVDALKPFEQATKFFSGSKYPTLSLMYPIIRELQNKFIDFSLELSNDNEDSNNEDDMLLESENDDDTHSHAPSPLPDLDQIEKQFKIAISDSLNKYWLDFREVGLVATLLDPRTKKMTAFTNREREKAETKLRNEFENLQHINITSNDQPVQQTSTSKATEIMQNPFFEGIFGVQGQEDTPLDEVARYLKITPITNANPWKW